MSASVILQAAAQHTQLVASLDELREAPAQLEKLAADLVELEKEIKENKARIKASSSAVYIARNSLDDIKSSSGTKMWYSFRGKKKEFQKKLGAKEQEYYDAVQAQEEAMNGEQMSMQLLVEARSTRSRLFEDVERYALVRSELEAMYESIFSGNTPEYIEDDHAEDQVKLAVSTYSDLSTRLTAERQVLELLIAVQAKVDDVFQDLLVVEAVPRQSQRELKVEKARTALAESQNMIIQAQSIQPQLKVDDLELPNIWSHVIPEGYLKQTSGTDKYLIREKLKQAQKRLKAHTAVQKSWIEAIQSGVDAAEREVTDTKEELFRVRRAICERVISAGGDLPPEYEEHNTA